MARPAHSAQRPSARRPRGRRARRLCAALGVALALAGAPLPAGAQEAANGDALVSLDFDNTEISDVIDLIARLTNKNFIYDDRVRGRVTIVSPTKISVEQAYAVFESVLQVKGFTTVETPGGAIKVIPIRDAKESNVETVRSERLPPDRDRFVTRLIPLRYIEAEPIVNTLKPLVSKEAAIAAYSPTNTVILTESASNIRRILGILQSIDVETYRESLAVIKVQHADAATLASQISEIYGAREESSGRGRTARGRRPTRGAAAATETAGLGGVEGGRVRIITDDRTNSLIVLAPRTQLEDVRELVAKLDIPVTGGGRIHVYYLENANAEELASTLNSLISGQPRGGGGGAGGQAQALRAQVSELAEGITVTADPATNALVIQASQEGFSALSQVIEKLDVERPQVLVEALIMEVDITDATDLGFNGIIRYVKGNTDATAAQATDGSFDSGTLGELAAFGVGSAIGGPAAGAFLSRFIYDARNSKGSGPVIESVIRAAASDSDTNILSAPHILTSDNEEAEIRVGDNIPIITSRVESAAGQATGLSSSVNVERQDIGVTLRVTPQITEGDTLRLDIFQEITQVNEALSQVTGAAADVGVALSNRRIENTVVVNDGDTVVVGGLVQDDFQDSVNKVPFLGDIPVLGWAFKSTSRSLVKRNLLVFLTPHIIRRPEDLERQTIRKREEFAGRSSEALGLDDGSADEERERRRIAEAAGARLLPPAGDNPVRTALLAHEIRYPLERMREIEQQAQEEQARRDAREAGVGRGPGYFLQAAIFGDEQAGADALTELIDMGFDGALIASERDGVLLYEVRLGPYASLEEAERNAQVIRRSHGLAPTVLVETAPTEEGEE